MVAIGALFVFVGCGGGSSDSSSGTDTSTSSTTDSSTSSDVQYNMCTKVSGTQAEVVCTVYDCDSDFDLEYSYNIKSNCETAAHYWLDNVTNNSGDTGSTNDTSSDSSNNTSNDSSGNEDVYVEKASCFQVVSEEWNTACNNSLAIKWRNTCAETLDIRHCIDGTF